MTEPIQTTLPGIVKEIIKSSDSDGPEKAQIGITGADQLTEDIRIVNTLTKKNGDEVRLKKGATVSITIKA